MTQPKLTQRLADIPLCNVAIDVSAAVLANNRTSETKGQVQRMNIECRTVYIYIAHTSVPHVRSGCRSVTRSLVVLIHH